METRVSEITLQNFRGVSGVLTVSLCSEPNKPPQSLLLFGDNGTGKSSVIDAIEYALQGRLWKNSPIWHHLYHRFHKEEHVQ